MNNHSLQNTEEEPIRARFDPSRTRRTHEVPFIAGRSHFTRKNTRFPAPAFPQNEAHVTSMQPLQCVLQLQLPNPHLSTIMATQNDNDPFSHYTAICNQRVKKRIELRTHEQPLIAEHRGGTDSRPVRPQPHPPHTRGTFHRRPEPLYTEKHKVSCPGFPPKRSPCNIHAAITMRFATSASKPASLDAHGNTKRQRPCSHYTAICSQRVKKRIELRTHEQPLIAEHRGGTDSRPVRPQPHPPHTRGTFHRRPEPLYTEKHKVSCPGFPPKRSPCNIHAAITMRFATSASKPASLDDHGNTKRQRPCSHYTAICNQRAKKRIELRTHEQPLIAEHRGGTDSRPVRPQPHPPHTRGTFHHRPEPLYTEKHKVSCPGFPPKRSPCNIHAAITMRFATSASKPASLDDHGNTKRQRPCSHYTAICNQRAKKRIELRTHEQPLIAEHRGGTDSRPVRPQPHPPHTRGTFHHRPEPLYTEKHKVSCPGFPPKRSPCNIHAAITMRFATSASKPASLDAHGNTKRQRPCSHYTAICNQRVKKRIELRTHEQPLIAEHRGGTDSRPVRPQPHPPHTRGTFHRRPEPLYTERVLSRSESIIFVKTI